MNKALVLNVVYCCIFIFTAVTIGVFHVMASGPSDRSLDKNAMNYQPDSLHQLTQALNDLNQAADDLNRSLTDRNQLFDIMSMNHTLTDLDHSETKESWEWSKRDFLEGRSIKQSEAWWLHSVENCAIKPVYAKFLRLNLAPSTMHHDLCHFESKLIEKTEWLPEENPDINYRHANKT